MRRLWWVAGIAVGARVAVIAATPGYRPIHDDASYARVARALMTLGRYPGHRLPAGGWQESAYRPPGWPGALWATWSVTGRDLLDARLVEAAVGAAAAVLVAVLARRLFGGRAGLAAGLLAALSPLALAVGASLESQTLFTALVPGGAVTALEARRWASVRWAIAAGALAGLAALTRTNGLLVAGAIAVLAAPAAARGRARAGPALAALLAALAVVAPWTVHNAVGVHAFVPVSTETGNTLAGTYNDVSRRHDARWLEPRHTGAYHAIYRRYGASAQGDAALRGAVLRWVERHPAYPLRVVAADSARLLGLTGPGWAAFSLHTMSLGRGMAFAVWLGVLLSTALTAAGMVAARGRGVPAGLWLLLAALFVPAALVNGELRLAAPAHALGLVFAGTALARAQTTMWPVIVKRRARAQEPTPAHDRERRRAHA